LVMDEATAAVDFETGNFDLFRNLK